MAGATAGATPTRAAEARGKTSANWLSFGAALDWRLALGALGLCYRSCDSPPRELRWMFPPLPRRGHDRFGQGAMQVDGDPSCAAVSHLTLILQLSIRAKHRGSLASCHHILSQPARNLAALVLHGRAAALSNAGYWIGDNEEGGGLVMLVESICKFAGVEAMPGVVVEG
jgi:hypothetical protein